MGRSAFAVTADDRGECVLLTLMGEIDLASAHVVRRTVERTSLARAERLILDMAAVTFIDSTGLGALVVIRRVAHRHGTDLFLANPSRKVTAVLQLAGLTAYFPVWPGDTPTGASTVAG